MEYKECNTCKKWKPLSEFPVNWRMVGGHINKCRECYNQYQREVTKNKRKAAKRKDWPCQGCAKRSGMWCMRLRKSVGCVTVCPMREGRQEGEFVRVIYE